jgi:hypothetical protein
LGSIIAFIVSQGKIVFEGSKIFRIVGLANDSINCIQLTVKSVTFFAKAKKPPLFTSADAGVSIYILVFKKQVYHLT